MLECEAGTGRWNGSVPSCAGCVAGYYSGTDGSCAACTASACDVGMYRGACGASSDAVCEACTTKPLNAAYLTAGSPANVDNCSWTCNAGYWRFNSSCVVCNTSACGVGFYRGSCGASFDAPCQTCTDKTCEIGFYRRECGLTTDAQCVTCTNKPLNASYISSGIPADANNCSWTCDSGHWRS